jgi:hypothetical protein
MMATVNWTSKLVKERLEAAASILRCPSPLPDDVMEEAQEAFVWLDALARNDVCLVRMRADRIPWKVVCKQLGIARATANRRYQYMLNVIACRLNGQPAPSTWSRRYLLKRARELSSSM